MKTKDPQVTVDEIRREMDRWRGMPEGPEKDRKTGELEARFADMLAIIRSSGAKN